jgi:hypothetical protein
MQSPWPKRPFWDPFEDFAHENPWEGGQEEALSEEDEYRPHQRKRKDTLVWPIDAETAGDTGILGEE